MKAILEFDFDKEGSDDRNEFNNAINGFKWRMIVWELDNWLRGEIKHPFDDISNDTYKTFEQCREKLREFMNDENLTFNESN